MFSKFTLLLVSVIFHFASFSQGSESFNNIPTSSSTYAIQNWTGDNGLPWSATDARTDQTLNDKAITIRNGAITVSGIPNGIASIRFTHQRKFNNTDGILQVSVNDIVVGTVPSTPSSTTTQFLNINVSGNFNLEISQTFPGGRIAIDDVIWDSYSIISACTEPVFQPTALNLQPAQNSISGSFVAPNPAADEYLILRTTAASLSNSPVDAVSYTAGQILGNAVVVAKTSQTSFTDNGLTASTNYRYFIFSLNTEDCSGGPNYNITNPLTGTATTLVETPCIMPLPVSNLSLTPANEFIAGSFTASPNANNYLVVLSSSSSLGGAFPFDGFTYTIGQVFGNGTVIGFGPSTAFTATDLMPNATYYIFVFSSNVNCTGAPAYNVNPVSGFSTTTNTSTGIPTGFYNSTSGLTCQPLKTALKNISSNGYHSLSYTPGLWNAYQYTDIKPGTTNLIWDIYTDDNNPAVPETYNFVYSNDQCGSYDSEGDCYNREHTMPKSWFDDASPMESDIHHILPTDGWVNGMRSNHPYGNVSNPNFTSIDNQSKRGTGPNNGYSGIVFEPIDAFKGDVARIAFYMATRYEDEIIADNWAGNAEASVAMLVANEAGLTAAQRRLQIFDNWYLKTLYDWHLADPVSEKEINRNNAIYYESGQSNRNPFVDHPEYVQKMFECSAVLPVTISKFAASRLQHAVRLNWEASFESNFSHFSVERSLDAVHFSPIGTVDGSNFVNYYFTDNQLPEAAVIYYRLKMMDLDGSFTLSRIVSVRMPEFTQKSSVFPNPNKGIFSVKLSHRLQSNGSLTLLDLAGRTIKNIPVEKGLNEIAVQIPGLPAGRYFVKIQTQQEMLHHSIVVLK